MGEACLVAFLRERQRLWMMLGKPKRKSRVGWLSQSYGKDTKKETMAECFNVTMVVNCTRDKLNIAS